MQRPYFKSRISELELELARCANSIEDLRRLLHELGHRSTDRALSLKGKVVEALSRLETSGSAPDLAEAPLARRDSPLAKPDVSNAPEAILDAWTALEVLSPPAFRRPEDLAGGDFQAVARFNAEHLPWEGGGEKARPKTKLFYQIVLGTIDLEAATHQLLARFADARVERPRVRGEAVLSVVIVDREGRLAEAPAVSVSSFAWGVPRALREDLSVLADWTEAERSLVEGLDEVLRRARAADDDGKEPPLDRATLEAGWEWLVGSLGLPRELVTPPRLAIRSFVYYQSPEPPDPLLLNSFFLKDLSAAKALFAESRATTNLQLFLGCDAPPRRRGLLHDTEALEEAVSPGLTPPARWPGPGRNPLVLLQQAAVNLAFRELKDHGIFAVNGPPGTGKTTLLRDLVAGIVTARAEAMAGFEDPVSAFSHSGEKLKVGAGWLHLYRLDAKLKGFEMIVASSNNKAVENVSAELPDLKAIAQDAADLRYFSTLSDKLRQRETWGLIAAVLGNAANRGRFQRTFWWDDHVGFSKYLAEATGTPQLVEVLDTETGARQTRRPEIVTQEDPPRNHEEALARWGRARAVFCTALEQSRRNLRVLEELRQKEASLPSLIRQEAEAAAAVEAARIEQTNAQGIVEVARSSMEEVEREYSALEQKLATHDQRRPGFFARLFRTQPARDWRSSRAPLAEAFEHAKKRRAMAWQSLAASEGQLRQAGAQWEAVDRHRSAVAGRLRELQRELAAARERLGDRFIGAEFFACEHEKKHRTAPWLDSEQQRARDDAFVAAMALHKAFIDVAARPLKHNLGALMKAFGGGSLPTSEKKALLPDLWASLFLVVPLISTTFASVERMLGDLPAEALGWLFVDEAGQALPQATVGALMRSRRAVVVGDPVQIEPVVVLPGSLTYAICQQFGVDPDRFNAPNGSVQTLADAATPYYAEFEGRQGSRVVGAPLLVHRRCAEPMFGISNAVAYDRLMVNAKTPAPSRIGDVLGPSAWIDVQGSAVDKWCSEEGEAVLSLLRRLAAAKVAPDLYVVTPFVIVASKLRKLVRESEVLAVWTNDARSWVAERIGTVHTVQGREAEAVVFVLGAPAAHQTGARAWAGGKPNLLNVAVTRAKERLYVIGNRSLWRDAGLFRELDSRL